MALDRSPRYEDEALEDLGPTGHDLHFLSRLRRADEAATERAMRLYRDPDLMRQLLACAVATPVGVDSKAALLGERHQERVAIALGPGELPPRAIVARNGHFVTCLGAGMVSATAGAVAWEVTERLVQIDDAVDALARVRNERRWAELVRPLHKAGFRMTRQQFRELKTLGPIAYHRDTQRLAQYLADYYRLARLAAAIRRPRKDDAVLRDLWSRYHAVAHHIVLSSLGGAPSCAIWCEALEGNLETSYVFGVFLPLINMGSVPVAARSLWAIGLAGASAMPILEHAAQKATTLRTWRGVALSLLLVGACHRELADKALALLQSGADRWQRETDWAREQSTAILDMARWAMRRQEELSEAEIKGMRAWGAGWCEREEQLKWLLDREGLPPLELARSVLINLQTTLDDTEDLQAFLRGMPFLASMRPDDFFHPAHYAHLVESGYDFEFAMQLRKPWVGHLHPQRVEPKAGRNDPCSCGSGRKYKKCCGAACASSKGPPVER